MALYDEVFGEEIEGIPERPDIHEHLKAVSLVAKRAAQRVSDKEGYNYRKQLAKLSNDCCDHLDDMMKAEMSRDMEAFRAAGPKLSRDLGKIQRMSEDGMEDIAAEQSFFKIAKDLLQRVEAYEDLSVKRAALLSSTSVDKLIARFATVLQDNLPDKAAQHAFRSLVDGYDIKDLKP